MHASSESHSSSSSSRLFLSLSLFQTFSRVSSINSRFDCQKTFLDLLFIKSTFFFVSLFTGILLTLSLSRSFFGFHDGWKEGKKSKNDSTLDTSISLVANARDLKNSREFFPLKIEFEKKSFFSMSFDTLECLLASLLKWLIYKSRFYFLLIKSNSKRENPRLIYLMDVRSV